MTMPPLIPTPLPEGRHLGFDVLGEPAPKGSARAVMIKGRGGGDARAVNIPSGSDANKAKLKSWAANVRDACAVFLERGPIVGAVRVTIDFRFPRLRGHYNAKGHLRTSAPLWQSKRPDVDKLARATLDAMTGSVFVDDDQVASLAVSKAFCRVGEPPGAFIVVMQLVDIVTEVAS